jgi:hypothetical protein
MNSNRFQIALWTAALLSAVSTPVDAQLDMVEGVFEEVKSVTIFYQWGKVSDPGTVTGDDLRGAGLEVLIDVASSGSASLELGLGASFMRGYEFSDPRLDLHTSVRALPTVSLYAGLDAPRFPYGDLSGYLGWSFGLVDLWNAQAYDTPTGRAWSIEAQTFEYGPSAGLYWTSPAGVGFFGEIGYRYRRFPSAKWTLPDSTVLPEELRSLDLSASYFQFGVQLRVKEDKKDKNDAITPPAPAGIWTLERVNGAELPVTLDSADGGQRQLVHAVLRLEPADSTYSLDLSFTRSGSAGVVPIRSDPESGRYAVADTSVVDTREHILTFRPTGEGGARTAERLAGRLYLNWNGHVLVFAPGTAAKAEDDDS